MARRKMEPATPVQVADLDKTPATAAALEVLASTSDAEGAALVNQLLGQSQAFIAMSKFSRTFGVSKLLFVKENKLYRSLRGQKNSAQAEFSGTWEEFCGLLGMSVDKVDEEIKNLRVFGQEAYDAMTQMGVGYKLMQQFRRLPDDSRQALTEVAKDGDKDQLLELAETLIERQAKEKDQLQEKLEKAEAAATKATDAKTDAVNRAADLEAELTAAKTRFRRLKPEEKLTALRQGVTLAVTELRSMIGAPGNDGGLAGTVRALLEEAEKQGTDEREFLGAAIAELLVAVQIVRDDETLPVQIPVAGLN